MHSRLFSAGLAATIMAALAAAPAHAQSSPPEPTRSTLDGVYSAAQAERGKDVYAGFCQACHTPSAHTGAVFTGRWAGWPLAELYSYISNEMPQDNPGSLTPTQYVDVMAYLLQLNGMPKGEADLPRELKALREIRFDTASARPRPQRDR